MSIPAPFRKRTFTLPLLASSLSAALRQLPVAARGLRHPATSRTLQEQVMLAVTSVNDCRYCDWVHSGLALAEGVDLDALRATLAGHGPGLDERATVAILYAQHVAGTGRPADAAAQARLDAHFSAAEQREINAFIALIGFANLSGNSADAVLARLRGQAVPQGHLLAEVLAGSLAAPVLLAIALRSRRQARALAAL